MQKKRVSYLIWLCWLVYTCSYIGKINYSANKTLVMDFYGVDKAQAGLVSTFFFFAYGVGQVVHGMFCKKYNIRWMIFGSLLVSATANVIVGFCQNFEIVKFVWLLNGFSMSVLWPTLIRFLSETLPKDDMKQASITMGTTVAVGTMIIYALSALMASININFKAVFYIAAAIFVVVALVWASFCMPLQNKVKMQADAEEVSQQATNATQTQEMPTTKGIEKSLILLCAVTLGIFGVMTNLVKDGLTEWVPTILKEQYKLDDSLSIILTLSLPMVAIFGNALAVKVHKKIPDFVFQCAVNFLLAGCIIVGVIVGLALNQFVLTVIGFAAVCLLVSSCNSVITSVFPLFMKGKVNSGRMAGLLNGCCYVGSTITTYGLGWIADNFGWYPVFWLLFSVCALVCVIACVYGLLKYKLKNKENSALMAENS